MITRDLIIPGDAADAGEGDDAGFPASGRVSCEIFQNILTFRSLFKI